jgi:hypothetical protein
MSDASYRTTSSIERLVDKHEQDLYRGNGKPGITNRIESLENALAGYKEFMRDELMELRTKQDSTDNKFWAIIILLITILAGLVATLATTLAKH